MSSPRLSRRSPKIQITSRHCNQPRGTTIDLTSWKFRKPLPVTKPGVQQIQLDPEVLAHSASDLRDLRVVSNNKQWPYLIETTSILSDLPLPAVAANDPRRPTLSRWSVKLPQPRPPLTSLTCESSTPAFERIMRLREEVADERGDKYVRELGGATWRHLTAQPNQDLSIKLDTSPLSDNVFLETDNHDNPGIDLNNIRAHYPLTRLLFKAPPESSIWLYYGNADMGAPQYDTSLMADELLRAMPTELTAGPVEQLKAGRVTEALSGAGRYIFWVALALSVITLLFLVSRLLPKAAS
jgi:hypothetical protein